MDAIALRGIWANIEDCPHCTITHEWLQVWRREDGGQRVIFVWCPNLGKEIEIDPTELS